jgi:peptide deformylase
MIVDTLPTEIVRYPDPRLRRKCAPIEDFDESLAALAERMLELMHAGQGIGLAGPQVGVCRRIFVCNHSGEPGDDRVFVNPELFDLVGTAEAEEGCLSLPDVHVTIRRAKRCKIRAFDVTGVKLVCEGEDLTARIFQHETAHLDGGLIIDMMNGADKIANKRALAELEAKYGKAAKRR